jgi:hypothetical protein
LDYTYSLSAAIWFLDRLGDERDVLLIQHLAVRLMAGQNEAGGWSYFCPTPSEDDQARLRTGIWQRDRRKNDSRPDKEKDKNQPGLPPEIEDQLRRLQGLKPGLQGRPVQPVEGDNSNTQFAALALWVARRHHLPVDPALARLEKRFRSAQHPNGGWHYLTNSDEGSTSPAMACAGLLGLAVGQGAANDGAIQKSNSKDRNKDPNIRAAFRHLEHLLLGLSKVKVMAGPQDQGFYFLWSLERVAEIYGLKTIGGTDWYAWGSTVLINSQMRDGSWRGAYSQGGVDTSLALLFLLRSNVAKDLTVILRAELRDQDKERLKAGAGEPRK